MSLGDSIRVVREKAFLTQESFAKELNVATSTVNRWENERVRPNLSTMKDIKTFCESHDCDYSDLEKNWLESRKRVNRA